MWSFPKKEESGEHVEYIKNPKTGEVSQVTWEDIQEFEEKLRESGQRLPKSEWRNLQNLKKRFPQSRSNQRVQRSERLKQGVDRFNKASSAVERGAKTFQKGFHKRYIEGGHRKPKSGYWRDGTYYPYNTQYKKKMQRSRQTVMSNGQEYVIVNGKAYPVKGSKRSRSNSYQKKRHSNYQNNRSNEYQQDRNAQYRKKKKDVEDDDPEINGFFNLFG